MTGPLRQVLAAFEAGCGSLAEVAERTGLGLDSVRAATEHLVRMGRLEAKELSMGCPTGGCTSCASGWTTGPAAGRWVRLRPGVGRYW